MSQTYTSDHSIVYLSSTCSDNCTAPIAIHVVINPPAIDFSEEMVVVDEGEIVTITNSTMTGDLQEFVLHIQPASTASSLTVFIPEDKILNVNGFSNSHSNTLTISLLPPLVTATIISRSAMNQNPYDVLIDFSAPILIIPEQKHFHCQNCLIQSVNAVKSSRLRVVISIIKEGNGELRIPHGIAVSNTGGLSEQIVFPFYFGRFHRFVVNGM